MTRTTRVCTGDPAQGHVTTKFSYWLKSLSFVLAPHNLWTSQRKAEFQTWIHNDWIKRKLASHHLTPPHDYRSQYESAKTALTNSLKRNSTDSKEWKHDVAKFREEITSLNKRIDKLNLITPSLHVQMVHFNAQRGVELLLEKKDKRSLSSSWHEDTAFSDLLMDYVINYFWNCFFRDGNLLWYCDNDNTIIIVFTGLCIRTKSPRFCETLPGIRFPSRAILICAVTACCPEAFIFTGMSFLRECYEETEAGTTSDVQIN